MQSNEMLNNLSIDIKRIFGDSLSKLILYGSRARGDYNVNSDYDLIALVNLDDIAIKQIKKQVYDKLFDYQNKNKVDMSILIKNKKFYDKYEDALPFFKNIKKDGVVLYG